MQKYKMCNSRKLKLYVIDIIILFFYSKDLFNLDKLNRDSNSDKNNPAQFIVRED